MAGMKSSIPWLIVAVVLNGIASSMMFTTYRTLYGKKSQSHNRSKIFGVYFSSINMAYVIGALMSAVLVSYIELPFMYLFYRDFRSAFLASRWEDSGLYQEKIFYFTKKTRC